MHHDELPLEIDCVSVRGKLERGEPFLFLDCREAKEHALVSIPEATLLPMSELAARVGELEPRRGELIVVHCHHGGRSLRVTHWLRQQGFAQVQSMAGGIDQWATEIVPGMLRY